jgi:RHS repeat-associated protein
MKVGSNKYYFSQNMNSSVEVVTNSSGAVAEKYRYDAYGGQTILSPSGAVLTSSAISNRIGYTGRYQDETGLLFFRTRYYSPRLGRFISRDRAFFNGPNLYQAYFAPHAVDPTGQSWLRSIVHGVSKAVKKAASGVEAAANKVKAGAKSVANDLTKWGVEVLVKVNGQVQAELSICHGDLTGTVSAGYEAGVEFTTSGIKYFVGVEGSWTKAATGHPFAGLNCGGDCNSCCVPHQVTAAASLGTEFPAMKWAQDHGFNCNLEASYDGCATKFSYKCEVDGVTFIAPLNTLKKTLDEARNIPVASKYLNNYWKFELAAPIEMSVNASFCKGPYGPAFKDATLALQGKIELGVIVGSKSNEKLQ